MKRSVFIPIPKKGNAKESSKYHTIAFISHDFILGGSKITADGDYSHEIKSCLLLGRKAMTNLDSVIKSTHYFADKGPYGQSYGFSSSHVWM